MGIYWRSLPREPPEEPPAGTRRIGSWTKVNKFITLNFWQQPLQESCAIVSNPDPLVLDNAHCFSRRMFDTCRSLLHLSANHIIRKASLHGLYGCESTYQYMYQVAHCLWKVFVKSDGVERVKGVGRGGEGGKEEKRTICWPLPSPMSSPSPSPFVLLPLPLNSTYGLPNSALTLL